MFFFKRHFLQFHTAFPQALEGILGVKIGLRSFSNQLSRYKSWCKRRGGDPSPVHLLLLDYLIKTIRHEAPGLDFVFSPLFLIRSGRASPALCRFICGKPGD